MYLLVPLHPGGGSDRNSLVPAPGTSCTEVIRTGAYGWDTRGIAVAWVIIKLDRRVAYVHIYYDEIRTGGRVPQSDPECATLSSTPHAPRRPLSFTLRADRSVFYASR